ncbi:MAG: hypothetical protein R6U63_06775 [Longimicrobiales bacterium]
MARYDRIARLEPPQRDDAFTGWLAVRDLEGRERDTDLARRARLRFLAVRLIHRLIRRGSDLDRDSLQQQCDTVREELGQLPSRDPERERLAGFLKEVTTLDMATIVRATLGLADAARAEGHPFAAEEFYRTAVALAERHDLGTLRSEGVQGLAALDREPAPTGA